jgi:hypothetical protein
MYNDFFVNNSYNIHLFVFLFLSHFNYMSFLLAFICVFWVKKCEHMMKKLTTFVFFFRFFYFCFVLFFVFVFVFVFPFCFSFFFLSDSYAII